MVAASDIGFTHLFYHSPIQGFTMFKMSDSNSSIHAPNKSPNDFLPCSSGFQTLDPIKEPEQVDVQKFGIMYNKEKFPYHLFKGVYPPYNNELITTLSHDLKSRPIYLIPYTVWVG
jgi:hypothetical protein